MRIYWDEVLTSINYLIYIVRFNIIPINRSTKILITSYKKRIDAKGEMKRLEQYRDNLENYFKSIPDECIIDLSNKVYCNGR